MAIKTGSLEIALSIQKASALVTVTVTPEGFTTDPENLFLLTFDDEKVALSDDQMNIFKERLKQLLPEIAEAIDGIANDASQAIADVQDIVSLALAAKQGQD